jgi:chemotaxis protein MotB
MGTRRQVLQPEEEESYFASMTDVFIGLLFIFIIMLMFFAIRFQDATASQEKIAVELKEATANQEQVQSNYGRQQNLGKKPPKGRTNSLMI